MINVFIVSEADDIGGVAAAIVRAHQRHGDQDKFRVWAMRGSNNYIDYPEILHWDPDLFGKLYDQAHVIHAMETWANIERFTGEELRKPTLLHHHGTTLRDNPLLAALAKKRGYKQVASTLDLILVNLAIEWLPNPVPVGWFELFGSQYAPSPQAPFTVGHVPTQRHMKNTDMFLSAAAQAEVQVSFTEYVPWVSSLVAKARCHAYFDQLLFGFGLSALEAWAMHRPVIAGVRDAEVRELMLRVWGSLPFIDVRNERELVEALVRLRTDPGFVVEMAEVGNLYVRAFHDERLVIRTLERMWAKLV